MCQPASSGGGFFCYYSLYLVTKCYICNNENGERPTKTNIMKLIESTEQYQIDSYRIKRTVNEYGRVKWSINDQACTAKQARLLNALRMATDEGDDTRAERLAETLK